MPASPSRQRPASYGAGSRLCKSKLATSKANKPVGRDVPYLTARITAKMFRLMAQKMGRSRAGCSQLGQRCAASVFIEQHELMPEPRAWTQQCWRSQSQALSLGKFVTARAGCLTIGAQLGASHPLPVGVIARLDVALIHSTIYCMK